MAGADDYLPDDTDALKAALTETRAKLVGAQALIEHLQLVIAKMQREKFGPRSERSQRLIDQLELQLEELVMLTLIQTAKLNDIDPQAWLADVLARINDHAIHRLDELLPWNWAARAERRKVAA
jgi:hypothetical protein